MIPGVKVGYNASDYFPKRPPAAVAVAVAIKKRPRVEELLKIDPEFKPEQAKVGGLAECRVPGWQSAAVPRLGSVGLGQLWGRANSRTGQASVVFPSPSKHKGQLCCATCPSCMPPSVGPQLHFLHLQM